jgi:methionine aminotransferase
MQSPLVLRSKLQHNLSIFARMTALANEVGAINLAQGFPDFPPPAALANLVAQAIQDGHNQYAPMAGVPELRRAIARKTLELYHAEADPDTDITITAGATYGLFTAFQALLHEGDEVLIFEPAYDSYIPGIQLAGAEPVFIALQAPDYSIDWESVKKNINSRTRAIVINTPHNPSGSCWKPADMLQLEKLVEGSDIIIISDEVYEHITFGGVRHESVLRYPKLAARSIVVASFGKTYHNTGWKMGYVIAPEAITREFRNVHQYLLFSVNTPMQHALAAYITAEPNHYLELPAFYEQKRNTFLELLEGSRFTWQPAAGTYFQILDYSAISDKDDLTFALQLARDYKIAAIPLSPFYRNGQEDKVLRFCFAKSDTILKKAAEILCKI